MPSKGMVIAGNSHDGCLVSISMGRYEGSVRLQDGRFDRKVFTGPNLRANEAKFMWETWKDAVRKKESERMRLRVNPSAMKAAMKELTKDSSVVEALNEKAEEFERKAQEIADGGKKMAQKSQSAASGTVYVVMVVGGTPVFVVRDEDKALSVCDALAAGAKASGFDAKYDVVEVKVWD